MSIAQDRKLSNAEIDFLYSFCVKHYVRDYDVQVELVDHLSNAIEDLWINTPELTFEKALELTHKTFGYKGFASIVQEKTKAIEAQHSNSKRKIFLSFFTWPKAAFTFMIAAIVIILPKFLLPKELKILIAFVLVLAMLIQFFFTWKFHKTNRKQQKQLLLTANVTDLSDGSNLMYIFFPYHRVFDDVAFDILNFYFLSALLFVLCISFYISITYGKAIMAKAKNAYPLAFV